MAESKSPQKKKTAPPDHDLGLESFRRLLGAQVEENLHKDRVQVITSVAEIDTVLRELLERRLCIPSTTTDRDEILAEGGPIGTLVLRGRLARRLGLISSELFQVIKQLAEIRNECAHNESSFNVFKDPSISQRVSNIYSRVNPIYYGKETPELTVELKFTRITSLCSVWLQIKRDSVEPLKPPAIERILVS